MIQLSGVTKAFGERVLLDDVTWQVDDGVNHEMPWTHHRKILEVLVHSVAGPQGG